MAATARPRCYATRWSGSGSARWPLEISDSTGSSSAPGARATSGKRSKSLRRAVRPSQAGQRGAETEVHTVAEGEVVLVRPGDVEGVGVRVAAGADRRRTGGAPGRGTAAGAGSLASGTQGGTGRIGSGSDGLAHQAFTTWSASKSALQKFRNSQSWSGEQIPATRHTWARNVSGRALAGWRRG